MKRILRPTRVQKIESLAFVAQLIFLTLLLSSCAGLRPFPAKYLIEYDARHKVCGQYEIIDAENFKFKYIKDIPCVSVFGFNQTDISPVLNWARDAQKYAKEHCQ